jgi:arylsulfatase A-like enzyme
MVVLTSDHGESLGEHGEGTHGFFLYESTLRIPLLIRNPGGEQGRRMRDMVRIIDIAPTSLDGLGVEMPADLEGRSLRPLIERYEEANSSAYAETLLARFHYGWSEPKPATRSYLILSSERAVRPRSGSEESRI